MKVMIYGTETNLHGAIKQIWDATKIYCRLRMNNIMMTKTHIAIIKALNEPKQSCIKMLEDNI